MPSLIERMMAVTMSKVGDPAVEALGFLLKRPWDPVLSMVSQHKPVSLLYLQYSYEQTVNL